MPSRAEVRSLSLPKNGLPTIASRAPTPATSARLFGACAVPTRELTFNANVTSSGARNSRLVLMNANVYSAMKPQPTRGGVPASAWSGTAEVPAGALSNPFSAAGAACRGAGMGMPPTERDTSGMALPLAV